MIYWAQLLHFYQPPTQLPSVLKKICNESYRPLIKVFEQYPHARATINVNGVLTEMLVECGHQDIIEGLGRLAQRGQLEFTGSGMYHPILPLIPKDEARRQINLNTLTNRRAFGDVYQPQGFFPPEMCYSPEILPPVMEAGYKWIILSGVACPAEWPVDSIYEIEHDGNIIKVLFRDDVLSNKISFRSLGASEFIEHLQEWCREKEDVYVVTAMDAETYGHHIQNWETRFLAEVFSELEPVREAAHTVEQSVILADQTKNILVNGESRDIEMVTITKLLDLFQNGEIIEPKLSSWSTSNEDLKANNPYPLWQDKNNEIHRFQWEHLNICIEMVNKAIQIADNEESRHFAALSRRLLDRAEHSCQMWWASRRPMWDLNLIHMGMLDQLRVIVNAFRSINKSSVEEKIKREYYYRTVAARDIRNKLEDRLFVQ